jgi:hypothetical protein
MTTIRLSADQNSATIPPIKAVRVRFVVKMKGIRCCNCDGIPLGICTKVPCDKYNRNDKRNGYWVAKAKKGGGK